MKIVLSDILKGKKRIALSGHVRPDGDCVGSSMGLYLYLTEQFPEIEVDLYLEKIPASFSIISRTEEIRHTLSEETAYDLFICLDCGDEQRLGPFAPLLRQAAHTVCIDHHVSNDAFAELNYIRPEASSTSELVYTLLEDEKISKACAEALYMGIAHDTGVFQYSCTSPETMEAAAQLLRKGIDGSEIIEKTYFEKTYIQNHRESAFRKHAGFRKTGGRFCCIQKRDGIFRGSSKRSGGNRGSASADKRCGSGDFSA